MRAGQTVYLLMSSSQTTLLAPIIEDPTNGSDGRVARIQRSTELAIPENLIGCDRARPVETVEHVVGFVQVQPNRLCAARAGHTNFFKSVPFAGFGQPERGQVPVIGSRVEVYAI